jgi:photosystem II stability/assembly factor-like uncharacterized protein
MKKLFFFCILLVILNNTSYAQWIRQVPPITGYFANVDFINSNTGYIAGGYEKLILKTTDSGYNWNYSSRVEGSYAYVLDIQIISEEVVYATMYHSLLKTTNGGINWTEYPYPISDLIYNIKFSSINEGFCIGEHGKILKTTNAGLTWELQNSNTGALLWDICMLDTNNFIVCGGSWNSNFATILKTTNKGEDWILINSNNWGFLTNISFIDKNTGYISGGNLLKTTNGGNNWIILKTGYQGFNCIYFPSAQTGYGGVNFSEPGGGNFNKIVKSTNYGADWVEMANTVVPGYIRGMDFNNNFIGWAIGDAFIEATSNGGSTSITNSTTILPKNFSLYQNYPNPFNPNTVISYKLSVAGNISLNIYDVNGRLIKILESGFKQAGNYSTNFSAEGLSSGVYYYSLYAGGVLMDTKKAVVMK